MLSTLRSLLNVAKAAILVHVRMFTRKIHSKYHTLANLTLYDKPVQTKISQHKGVILDLRGTDQG